MAIKREIKWAVAADGAVTPTTPLDGGAQGDHNQVRAIFEVAEGSAWADPANAVYIECVDGAANVDTTEQLSVVDGQVAYLIPRAWTQYGGTVTLRLVAEGPGVGDVQAYASEALARLDSRQNAMDKVDSLLKGRVGQLEKRAAEALDAAETAANHAAEDAEYAANMEKQIDELHKKVTDMATTVANNTATASAAAEAASTHRTGASYFAGKAEAAAAAAETAATALENAASTASKDAASAAADRTAAEECATSASANAQAAAGAATAAEASAADARGALERCNQYNLRSETAAAQAAQSAEAARKSAEQYIHVSAYGAVGDGVTDDTDAIQAALDCGGTIAFEPKTYLVNADKRLWVRSNSNITLPVGCTLQAMPTNKGSYTVLNITESVENVLISGGGRIVGDMSEDGKDPASQAGHGIRVRGSRNITIDGIEICDCCGDCIAIHGAYDGKGNYPNGNDDLAKNIVVRDCVLHDARRCGISIQGCNGFKSINNEIYGVYGTIPECGMDFEASPTYPNTDCELWNTRIHDVGVTGGITCGGGNESLSLYGCELGSVRLSDDIGKLNIDGCTIGFLRLVDITQLDKVLVHNCTIGRAELNVESPDVEFHKCDFVPMGDEEMYIRFLSTGKATDEKRLNHATFEGCYFRTRPNNALADRSYAMFFFSYQPLDTISLTNCVFEAYNQIGLNIVATNRITFTNNTVKQIHAHTGDGVHAYIMNFRTLQGDDSVIVFANNTVDLKGVSNYYYKTAETMRLYAANVYMVGNLIESTDVANVHGNGLSAILCKMVSEYNTKTAVVANNTITGSYSTYFTYPTTEGFVVKESNNLLLCKE